MTTATVPTRPAEGDGLTLELIEQIAAAGQLSEQQKRTVERQAGSLIQRTAQEPQRLRDVWSGLCDLAYAAGLEVLAPHREQIAASLALKEDLVRRGADLARRLEQLLGHPVEGADRLPAAAEDLRLFRTTVLDRWQTADDLAVMLIEQFPLSSDQLKRTAAAYPAPQSWYDDDFDPFTPDPEPKE